jgi:colanic acid/amylovoran biosynthesis glycosyltransferase
VSTAPGLVVAYLVNQYPKVSHSFIRREILALERQGLVVQRFAVRGWEGPFVDPDDQREHVKTRYLMQQGVLALILPMLRQLLAAPSRFFAAFRLALRAGWRADRSLPYHLVYLAQACRLVTWMRASRATHLHAHFGTNPAEVAMLSRLLGGPRFSFTVHGPEEFDRAEALKLGLKIEHAAFVVAISSYGRSQLYRWASLTAWHKIAVVHCGLDRSFHDHSEEAIMAATPRLVCVGRLCEQKGQVLLVEAAHRLAQRGLVFELVFAGDGEMRADVEAAVDRYGMGHGVRITGWIAAAQVRSEILAAHALVLPSFAEGLPVVLMEAMALGRPVVTTYVAGIPELVTDRETGWLVPAGDVDALAAAMQKCLQTSAEELKKMGRVARTHVLERHDIDVEAAKLAALFLTAAPA